MGIWRCSLQNQGGQTARFTTRHRLESRSDIHARLEAANSMYTRDMCTGQAKIRPNARDVPVKNANKARANRGICKS